MLRLLVSLHLHALHASRRVQALLTRRAPARADAGQSTAEYALVLLGAASVALLLVAWATKTDKITGLLDGIIEQVMDQVS